MIRKKMAFFLVAISLVSIQPAYAKDSDLQRILDTGTDETPSWTAAQWGELIKSSVKSAGDALKDLIAPVQKTIRDSENWRDIRRWAAEQQREEAEKRAQAVKSRIENEKIRLAEKEYQDGIDLYEASVRDMYKLSAQHKNVEAVDVIDTDSAYDQGTRVASGEGFATTFTGQSPNGSLQYNGTRNDGYISGTYNNLEEGTTGQFTGTIARSNRVSGTYQEAGETGSFTGQATPDLKEVIGSTMPD
ncbi:MAG: hypothetical protein JWO15_2984 [Sphingomonadales bacterium]|nr:hypothetical protein [Sphingomonadales bacterium]